MKKKILNLFVLILITGSATSQSLDDYLIIAAENNPNLKSKYFQYQSALERVPQVGALPDPQVSFGIFIEPMERYIGNQVAEISIMQMFPWFGTLSAAQDEMTLMAKARYEEFNEAKSLLFYEVRANWYALQLLEKEIAIAKENIELLKTMEQIAISRFRSGGGSTGSMGMSGNEMRNTSNNTGGMGSMNMASSNQPVNTSSNQSVSKSANQQISTSGSSGSMIDVLRVQMEINELQNSLALLEDSKIPLTAQFNRLLNRNKHEPVILSDSIMAAQIPIPVNEIPEYIKDNNPMLKMLEEEEAAFIARGKMNRKMGLPMIGLGLQYDVFQPRAHNESMMNGKDMLMPMATVTIPLWRKKYTASVRESDYMRQAVEEQKQEVSNQLMVSYEEALKDFRDADRRVKLYREQTSLANQALNILIAQYTTEGSNFEEVLRMQQQLLDYRLKYLDALIDGNIAVAMMEQLMGR